MAKDPDPVEWVQYPAAISAAPMARYRLGRGEWVVGVLATPPPVAASADLIGQRRHRTSAHTQRTETENKKEEPKKKSRNDRQKMKRTKKMGNIFALRKKCNFHTLYAGQYSRRGSIRSIRKEDTKGKYLMFALNFCKLFLH